MATQDSSEVQYSLLDGDQFNSEKSQPKVNNQRSSSQSFWSINPKHCFEWLFKDPWNSGKWTQKILVLLFVIIFIFCFLVMIIFIISPDTMDPDSSSLYVITGIIGLIVCVGIECYFCCTNIILLREQVDEMERENHEFKKQIEELSVSVNKLENGKNALESTQIRLEQAAHRDAQDLKRLSTMEQNMKIVEQKHIAGMSKIMDMVQPISEKWKKYLLEEERKLCFKVFNKIEMRDGDAGMTLNEYNQFLQVLPRKYKSKLEKLQSFKTLAGEDGKVSYQEFAELLDQMGYEFVTDPGKHPPTTY